MIHTNIKNAQLLNHEGRQKLINYAGGKIDENTQFLDESLHFGQGQIKYYLTIQKGNITNGCISYSVFEGIHLLSQKTQVSRATEKAAINFVLDIYNKADYFISELERVAEKWQVQQKTGGQVWYYCDKFTVYIKNGYAVECDKAGGEKVKRTSEIYKPYGLEADSGNINNYKYMEYNPVNLADVFAKYNALSVEHLAGLANLAEAEDKRQADEEKAKRQAEMEAQRREEEAKKAEFSGKLSQYKKYLILQLHHVDDSDAMTDYFSNKLEYVKVLGDTDNPIRSTFAGGRIDMWKELRRLNVYLSGLKYKGYGQGAVLTLKDKDYTGSGSYNEVMFIEKEKVSEYLIKYLK